MNFTRRRLGFSAALVAVTGLGAWLRLRALGVSCLWLDEIITAEAARRGPWFIVQFTLNDAGPLPLSYLFEWLSVTAAGDGEFWVRLPSAIFGGLTVPLAAAVAWRLGRSRAAGLIAAALLAVSEHHIYYSREARGYALLALVALLAFWLLLRALEDNRKRWWIGLALADLAGLYTSYFFLFAHAALAVWGAGWLLYAAARRERPRGELLRRAAWLAAVVLVTSAAFVPWLAAVWDFFARYREQHARSVATIRVGPWLAATLRAWLPTEWEWRAAAGALIVLGDLLLLPARRGLLTLLAVLWLGLPSLAFSHTTPGHALTTRYLIAALPFFTVGVALGLGGLIECGRRWHVGERHAVTRRWLHGLAVLAAGTLLALNARLQLAGYNRWATAQKQDWRTAATFIQTHFRRGDQIIPGIDRTDLCLRHYLPRPLLSALTPTDLGRPRYVGQATREVAAHGLRAWYVAPAYALGEEEAPGLRAWLEEYYTLAARIPASQSEIFLYLGPKTNAAPHETGQPPPKAGGP